MSRPLRKLIESQFANNPGELGDLCDPF